jgi:hypothetical protein
MFADLSPRLDAFMNPLANMIIVMPLNNTYVFDFDLNILLLPFLLCNNIKICAVIVP